ncbi:MAG: EAL domain-containing protein [Actinobacteria bacterium]|nr:EAL domain-containing protein [Actinomycetota bacterium]
MARVLALPAGQAPTDRLTFGASPAERRTLALLVGAAFLVAAWAVVTDIGQRSGGGGLVPVASRIPAALALALAGIAGTVAAVGRRARDTVRRKNAWLLVAVGIIVLYLGQALGYLTTAGSGGVFDVRVEVIPLLVGAPLLGIGALMLSWPPGMSRIDRWSVTADTLVAAAALLAVWLLVVAPGFQDVSDPDQAPFVALDPWLQFASALAVVAIASASRRSGSLPLPQLALLQATIVVYLTSDILGDSIAQADRASGITWSILGYVAATGLFCLLAVRPALETDTPRSLLIRERWSTLVPAVPVALMAVVAIAYRVLVGELTLAAGLAVSLTVVLVVVVEIVRRSVLHRQVVEQVEQAVSDNIARAANQEWFGALLGDSQDVVTVVDRRGMIIYQTPSMTNTFGYLPSELAGTPLADISPNTDEAELTELLLRAAVDESAYGPHDLVIADAHGLPHDTETSIRPLNVGGADAFVFTTHDVTDRRQLRAELSASGMRDPLTGLNNREGFLNRIGALHSTSGNSLAVALIDLVSFRDLNDGHGHEIGDEALRAVASSLTRMPDYVAAVGRIGGDEFALALKSEMVEADVGHARRHLQEDLCGVALSDGTLVDLGFSLGYAVCDGPPHLSSVELLERSDLALSSARRAGPLGITKFEPRMRTALAERLRAERALRSALENDRILVHYQPIVSFVDGGIIGVEALVRMLDDDGKVVSPGLFVPMAEDLGLIHRLGEVVLQQALRDLHAIRRALGRSLNVSALQLDPQLHPSVNEALRDSGTDPHDVTLELTETVLAENQEAASNYLSRLRRIGCRVALDDFGAGYSSLYYLASMPVDILKIDRSFVAGLGTSNSALVLVRAVVQLAASLGLATVAEGVETAEQAQILRDLGTNRAQGYYYSRPLPLADLLAMIEASRGCLEPGSRLRPPTPTPLTPPVN